MRKAMFFVILIILLSSLDGMAYEFETVMMPMRDEIHLATDIYRPSFPGSYPSVLIRTPYGREDALEADQLVAVCDILGYTIVLQDTRGRYDSEGVARLFEDDGWGVRQDGYDTVEWIAEQSWSDGQVGTIGASAMGITQTMMAGATPPHLVCQVPIVAASNIYEQAAYQGGAYRERLVENWIGGLEETYLLPEIESHAVYSEFWDQVNVETRYDAVNVPAFFIGGWHDIFCEGTVNSFLGLHANGVSGAHGNQKLLMGPYTHMDWGQEIGELVFPENAVLSTTQILMLGVAWFNYWMKGEETGIMDEPAVRYYSMGDVDDPGSPGNEWRTSETWPPDGITDMNFYLYPDGSLNSDSPVLQSDSLDFIFDPTDPAPTIGGRNLHGDMGPYDQSSVESRADVLTFTTEPLTEPVDVAGKIKVKLWASSDAVDTDFTAKLCDVYPDGRSILIGDGIIRARHRNSFSQEDFLTPGEIYEFDIDLWSAAIVFNIGHQIRVDISSSNYDRFAVNPNTGAPFSRFPEEFVTARNAVYFGSTYPSRLILPVSDEFISVEDAPPIQSLPVLDIVNYPNPFADHTVIRYAMVKSGRASVSIYDVSGRLVKRLADRQHQAGGFEVAWDGIDRHGKQARSGVYLMALQTSLGTKTQRMVLIR